MQGSYQLSPDSWLDLMIAYIRAREAIQDKRIFITSPGYQSLNHLFLSEPETIRLSLERLEANQKVCKRCVMEKTPQNDF